MWQKLVNAKRTKKRDAEGMYRRTRRELPTSLHRVAASRCQNVPGYGRMHVRRAENAISILNENGMHVAVDETILLSGKRWCAAARAVT